MTVGVSRAIMGGSPNHRVGSDRERGPRAAVINPKPTPGATGPGDPSGVRQTVVPTGPRSDNLPAKQITRPTRGVELSPSSFSEVVQPLQTRNRRMRARAQKLWPGGGTRAPSRGRCQTAGTVAKRRRNAEGQVRVPVLRDRPWRLGRRSERGLRRTKSAAAEYDRNPNPKDREREGTTSSRACMGAVKGALTRRAGTPS